MRWSAIRNIDVRLSNGVVLPNPQRWSDAISVGVGTEFDWLSLLAHPDWQVAARADYLHSETPIPDRNFNPVVPDANSHTLSVGVGMSCHRQGRLLGLIPCTSSGGPLLDRKALMMDLAFQAILWEPRSVRGSPTPGVNGVYRTRTYAGSLTTQINF